MKTVILGSGVMGVTTAWQLAKEGHEVVVVDRQPVAANETSFANAGLVAPGHALTWSSPRAPKILLKSLFRDDQALRLKLSADPRLWSWCLKFLRNCTSERARRNTLRKLKLCVYSQKALQELVAETGVEYDGLRKGLLYVYRDNASLERGIGNMAILRDAGQRMETLDRAGVAEDRARLRGEPVARGRRALLPRRRAGRREQVHARPGRAPEAARASSSASPPQSRASRPAATRSRRS